MVTRSATLTDHAVAARENCENKSPLGVVSIHPSFPPLHMDWLNRFRVYSREAAQVAQATPIRVLSRNRPGQTAVVPESHYADAWEVPAVKAPLLFMGTSTPVPTSYTNSDPKTDVARRDHEVSQNCVPTLSLVSHASPPKTRPLFGQPH
jgi:hypothetical protein